MSTRASLAELPQHTCEPIELVLCASYEYTHEGASPQKGPTHQRHKIDPAETTICSARAKELVTAMFKESGKLPECATCKSAGREDCREVDVSHIGVYPLFLQRMREDKSLETPPYLLPPLATTVGSISGWEEGTPVSYTELALNHLEFASCAGHDWHEEMKERAGPASNAHSVLRLGKDGPPILKVVPNPEWSKTPTLLCRGFQEPDGNSGTSRGWGSEVAKESVEEGWSDVDDWEPVKYDDSSKD